MRNKTIFATHKQTHDRSNDIKEPKADIKECNKHIYKHITNRDQQDKICIFMCKMSEFMSQCRPDLLIRLFRRPLVTHTVFRPVAKAFGLSSSVIYS